MSMTEALSLIPEGISVTSVIVVVILFLQHMKIYSAKLEAVGREFHSNAIQMQESFQSQLREITSEHFRTTRELSHSIESSASRTTEAIAKLEVTILESAKR